MWQLLRIASTILLGACRQCGLLVASVLPSHCLLDFIETLIQVRDASRGGLVLAAGVGARPRSQRAVDIFPFIQELQNCRLVVCLVLLNDVPQCDEFRPLPLRRRQINGRKGAALKMSQLP